MAETTSLRGMTPYQAIQVFQRAGYAVVAARNGSEALQALRRGPVDLIVLDVGMPEMDGLEVCRQVRKTSDVPILFLSARDEEIEPEEYWRDGVRLAGELAVVTWSSTTALLEISAAGVTKASTLELLCAQRGIAAQEVAAFGDMPNDLPMLAWAGTSYAMANAHPDVRALADRRIGSNDEEGVAAVLEGLLD